LDPVPAYNDEVTKIAGLQARIARQTNELALIKDKGASLVQLEVTIDELERNRAIDEEELNQIERTTEKATMDVELGPDRVTGISTIEQPTPPGREATKQVKLIAGIAGGGVALGLALAFLLEMVLDRSFRRPQEVASRLGLPFFLSVPYLNGNGKLRLPKPGKAVKLLPAGADAPNGGGAETAQQGLVPPSGGSEGRAPAPAGAGPIAVWDEKHAMRPFHETLRDRLIVYFEMLNLTHKPKLVAMTSCHHGAGVSIMASGLASVLSETGEGNVLLVNMNTEDGDAHRFYHGKPNMGLDDIFDKEKETREQALVSENLYVVKESSNRDKLPAILPRRFSHLVSKMKASDYDYIIFDMPPVTQISVTPRLARFMDMVLLVVESEKTDRDAAQRAVSLLAESRANMAVVMNKHRSYVPQMLYQEL
jgi:Mrp family chromosome partitioning ATPase